MWERLTELEREWKARCRRFADEVIAPHALEYDAQNAFPRAVHEAAYAAGLMNVGFAEELGGLGYSHRALAVGGEELAAACAPTAFTMGFNHGALRPVLAAGTSEQRQVFVRDLLARRGYASLCMTEPAASGSNLLALATRALRSERGWVLSGTKCMVGNGCDASLYVVMANAIVDGRAQGLSFFVVPRGEGVEVSENVDKVGFRCLTTPTIQFQGVEVPHEHLLGAPGDAEAILADALDYMRFGGGSVILGLVVGALRSVLPWIEDRKLVYGEPLALKSHVQLLLGELYTELRLTRLQLWHAAEKLDRGERASLETAMVKLAASRLAVRATNEIIQLFGWRGVVQDYGLAKRARDARVTTIYEGTSEIQLLNIYRELRESLLADGNL
jgi:alkylation response protein AidB-like acyl-CoA dehydrogenase